MWHLSRGTAVIAVTAAVLLSVAAAGLAGVGSGQGTDRYAVEQGGECFTIEPLTGNESVLQFYDYHSTKEDNPYTTRIGPGFSSEGTIDLQRAETSLLFLYRDPAGNLSLVMIHGARAEGVDGGSATFDLGGLPADGRWAVKDDQYDSPDNYDDWRHGRTTARIDWTWAKYATDGGAYEGLGEDFSVTIEPAFNRDAALYARHYNGTVDEWQALSGDRADPERTALDRSEPVTIATGDCEDGGRSDSGDDDGGILGGIFGDDDDDGGSADDGTETAEPATTTPNATSTPERGTTDRPNDQDDETTTTESSPGETASGGDAENGEETESGGEGEATESEGGEGTTGVNRRATG